MSDLDIRDAVLTRGFDLRNGGQVLIYLWKPEVDTSTPDNDYWCHYLIDGLPGYKSKVRRRIGVDSMQAFWLALTAVSLELYDSSAYRAGDLTYMGSRDLDLAHWKGTLDGGDTYAPAEVVDYGINLSIVRMPDTQFAHVAISGEHLNRFLEVLDKLTQAATWEDVKSQQTMHRLLKNMKEHQAYYEAVCKQAGIQLSYIKSQHDT